LYRRYCMIIMFLPDFCLWVRARWLLFRTECPDVWPLLRWPRWVCCVCVLPGTACCWRFCRVWPEIFFYIIKTHWSPKKGKSGRTMGSRASRQPHAPALAISRTADKRPGEFNFAAKGRGAGRDGWTRWGSGCRAIIYRISLG